jgi:hypothetical protein
MEKFWKIKNIINNQVKFTVCVKSNVAPGIILQPGQFCIGRQQMTAPLDKQLKTRMVSVEDFENTDSLKLAVAYNEK